MYYGFLNPPCWSKYLAFLCVWGCYGDSCYNHLCPRSILPVELLPQETFPKSGIFWSEVMSIFPFLLHVAFVGF